jgi:hypothetical protein
LIASSAERHNQSRPVEWPRNLEEVKAMMKYISIPLLLSLIAIAGCHVAAGVG